MFPPSARKSLDIGKVKRKLTEDDSITNKKRKADENVSKPASAETVSRNEVIAKQLEHVETPKFGQIVNRRDFRRAGGMKFLFLALNRLEHAIRIT